MPAPRAANLQTVLDDAWHGPGGWHFSGRLTQIRRAPRDNSSGLAALYRTTRMIFTHGAPGLATWRVAGRAWTQPADRHGYWELAGIDPLVLPPGWHAIESVPAASSPAGLLVADPQNPIGIISDIDDTILTTGVLSKPRLLKNSLLVPPERRQAVPGMAECYENLLQENPGSGASAVFYLSSSPRQLTDSLRRFLAAAGFPRGVLQLRKTFHDRRRATGGHAAYKLRHITAILAAFPQVRFHLCGDDAERDPEIYAQIQLRHPGQVAGVWIRKLNPNPRRPAFSGQRDVRELAG